MRGLRSDLDESKRKVSKLSQENHELNSHLDASEREKETLRETISQLDEVKQQQERALEKLNKEVGESSYIFDNTVSRSCPLEELKLQNTNHPLIFFLFLLLFAVSMSLCLCPRERSYKLSGFRWKSRERGHARKYRKHNAMATMLRVSWTKII